RYGELAAIRTADFNPDAGTVHIRHSKAGKARHVVLTDEGQDFFETVTAGREGDRLVFTKAGEKSWGRTHQQRPLREACKRARLTPPANFHVLRHTYASLLVMAGVPLVVVAKNLGHSDTRMCERHYAHLAPSYVADTIRAHAPKLGITEPGKVTPLKINTAANV
ncbi:MAG: site-specific integrase, partial [Alphaproteobacteria bacterium]|nr:site-specific integrase [Alphaproteobacteria bacterium]